MLPHIFDLFIQVDKSLDRSQGGLGIGLTLVRRLVELHHGTVSAQSAGPGLGSEFIVRLPAADAQPRQAPAGDVAVAQRFASERRRVLVVDDNVDAAETLAMLARLYGHEVRTVHDGASALDAAIAFQPEIVLLDIGLPGLDGYEVARRLRLQPGGDQILLAAVTGYGREEDRARAREAGFDHHLTKPFDPVAVERFFTSRQTRLSEQRTATAPM
jgi:two-component system CheB/CheR fusion protein